MPRRSSTPDVRVKRIYEPAEAADGRRVLVDRVWPRGVAKDDAALHDWCKAVAPSAQLRKWYGHEPARFAEFAKRYRAELEQAVDAVDDLRGTDGALTLLTATRDVEHSQAAVLAALLCE